MENRYEAKTKTYSDKLRELIDSALADRGISARKASMDVVGNDGLIRDIRAGRIPSADRLEALCDYLGLDFYYGPKREASELAALRQEFSDQAVMARILARFGSNATVAEMRDALGLGEETAGQMMARFDREAAGQVTHQGIDFTIVPLHEAWLSAGPGRTNGGANIIQHLAFRSDWLRRTATDPSRCCLARVAGDSMFPTLSTGDTVLIDTAAPPPTQRKRTAKDTRPAAIWAILDNGEARIKRIERPADDAVAIVSDNPEFLPEWRMGAQVAAVQFIGKVIWWGHTSAI